MYYVPTNGGQPIEAQLTEMTESWSNFAEEKGCSDRDFLNDLHTTSENFLSEKKDDIANYIAAYRIQYRDFSIKIEQENCH